MNRALPGGGASQRRVRQPMPKPILASVTHNKAAICRGKYAALFALPRKMNTAAVQKNMVDAIVLKKTEFDQIEAVEAALWLSTESAQQDGSDFTQLQKRHKAVVQAVNGIAKYFDNYTATLTRQMIRRCSQLMQVRPPRRH